MAALVRRQLQPIQIGNVTEEILRGGDGCACLRCQEALIAGTKPDHREKSGHAAVSVCAAAPGRDCHPGTRTMEK